MSSTETAETENLARLRAALFQPIDIESCRIANRVVMAPMTRNFAESGVVSELAVDYYRRRAAGGVGLILTEGVAVNAEGSPGLNVPDLSSEPALQRWREVTRAVHDEGGKIMVQLWHAGLLRGSQMAVDNRVRTIGPSGFFPRIENGVATTPHYHTGSEMTQRDIDSTIADCASFAQRARQIGFDGVEIHGAHGYLWDQFFWEETNRRSDIYAGSIGARARFAVDTVLAIKRAAGGDFPVGLRFSQWKLPNYYQLKWLSSPEHLAAFLEPLADAGVDFFDCSTRRYWQPEFEGSDLNLAGWTKKLTGRTTMTVGSVGLDGPILAEAIGTVAAPQANLERLTAMLERGDFDLVGVGRALIANPDWALRLQQGQTAGLRPFDATGLAHLH
jgi:2,4-dienoyl-CoA reductase-like NADH-dependent reductase (Old Yellow Enzyme family)